MKQHPPREFSLIDQIRAASPVNNTVRVGIGDDAAIIDYHDSASSSLVSCVDTMLVGKHFFEDVSPRDLGFKSLAVNLSDMAAMGATPQYALLSLTLPKADEQWLASFISGFQDIASRHALCLIGGDTTQGPLSVTVTVLGHVPAAQGLLRSGAVIGDCIAVTGVLGDAAYALDQINKGDAAPEPCLERLNRPEPRLKVGQALLSVAHSCIDISDGLQADLGHILHASACGAKIDRHHLPCSSWLQAVPNDEQQLQYMLAGGDDYELCFTYPSHEQQTIDQISQQTGVQITRIGTVTKAQQLMIVDQSGHTSEVSLQGYEHFK